MDNYEKSCQKWRELVKKIFGTENITWRLDPENGQIYFSTNGIEQIKATIIFLAMTKTAENKTKWAWAWAGGNRNLGRIQPMNRIMPEDINEYIQDGGTFEEPNLFKPDCLVLANTAKGKYYLRYMRAKMMDILDGQFVFEGDINGSNAIFVILKAKKIKQRIPEQVDDDPDLPEPRKTTEPVQKEEQSDGSSDKSSDKSANKSKKSEKPEKPEKLENPEKTEKSEKSTKKYESDN